MLRHRQRGNNTSKLPANIEKLGIEGALQLLDKLITGRDMPRNFEAAYHLARQLTQRQPTGDQPTIWTQLVLAANLTNRHLEAVQAHLLGQRVCSTWADRHHADCYRDHALNRIRTGDLVMAKRYLELAISYISESDLNRHAVQTMAEARLARAQHENLRALQLLDMAEDLWRHQVLVNAADKPNPQWRWNIMRWRYKCRVSVYGFRSEQAQRLYGQLMELMPVHGSPDLRLRLQLINRFSHVGNWLDDQLETPRVQLWLQWTRIDWLLYRFVRRKSTDT